MLSRYVHEPVLANGNFGFVGRESELEDLVHRILFSTGGSYLITGYRGVGKTSFINKVISELKLALETYRHSIGQVEIVDIQLNIARPLLPAELMHHVIRCIYYRLQEMGISQLLDPGLQEELFLAFQRTSINMTKKLSESRESNWGFNEIGLGISRFKTALKGSLSFKRARSFSDEMSYLGYDDKAAEYDIIRIGRKLLQGYRKPPRGLQRITQFFGKGRVEPTKLKIVFVFDELDKLREFQIDQDQKKVAVLDDILSSLKNLFTASGISFVFVAGKDLHDRWLEDVHKGDSLLESVFSYDKYLPCMWEDGIEICQRYIDKEHLNPVQAEFIEHFSRFIRYLGRGIARRLTKAFNDYVIWENGQPCIYFSKKEQRRIRFFSNLQKLLKVNQTKQLDGQYLAPGDPRLDKHQLATYYIVDWILNNDDADFSEREALAAARRLSDKIIPDELTLPRLLNHIIQRLLDGEYIEEVKHRLSQPILGAVENSSEIRYRILPRRLAEMSGFKDQLQEEFRSEEAAPTIATPKKQDEHFVILEKVAEGGMGTLYKALDKQTNQVLALKVLRKNFLENPDILKRFNREAKIMSQLHHPNIVRYYRTGTYDGQPYIAMQYIDGITLTDLLNHRKRLSLAEGLYIANQVASVLTYLHQHGMIRNDVKPGNIILDREGHVMMVDFGITKPLKENFERITYTEVMIGTPNYMAPEQIRGMKLDQRTDIFSFGVVLYELFTGKLPFDGESPMKIFYAIENSEVEKFPSELEIPKEVEEITLRCLEKAPEDRFSSMTELNSSLQTISTGDILPDISSIIIQAMNREKVHVGQTQIVDLRSVEKEAAVPKPSPQEDSTKSRLEDRSALPQSESGVEDKSLYKIDIEAPPPPPLPDVEKKPLADFEFNHITIAGDPDKVAELRIVAPDQGEKLASFHFMKQRIRIGRSIDNQIVLNDELVSRYQVEVYYKDGFYIIEDLNSANGTYLNDRQLIGSSPLNNGDRIKVGSFELEFKNPH